MPKFSFMVPVYNKEAYLARCMGSLLQQTFDDFEVVIVDDCSKKDNSYPMLKMLSNFDSRIKLYQNKENLGLGKTRNELLKRATGDYVIFVDPDDYVELKLLEKINEALEADSELEIVRFQNISEPATVKQFKVEEKKNPYRFCCEPTGVISGEEAVMKWMLGIDKINTMPWTYAVKRELYKGAEYPDIPVLEDFAITPYLLAQAKKVQAIDYVGYHYLQYDDSLTKSGDSIEEKIKFRKSKLSYFADVVLLAKKLMDTTKISEVVKATYYADILNRYDDKVKKYESLVAESKQKKF